ncbi:hypothetical protein PR048_026000 [Dryococelus australis]|uniref:Uncharacterized protein n=1 Tax=Dryococelus australis TaxID=614101 RepID=A0ABQ9GK43_9NEOP|nr:hypothetical protein PR048_026000 [Dryococelus australis]
MDAEFLKKEQGVLRAIINKTVLDALTAYTGNDYGLFNSKLFTLKVKGKEFTKIDAKMFDLLAANKDETDESLAGEAQDAQSYQGHEDDASRNNIGLPKLELKISGGELTQWLVWWAQVENINSSDLDDSEKFQHLLQSTSGKVHESMKSFPPTTSNYPKAVAALKERFGNAEILGEMYTRELLAMWLKTSRERQDIQYVHDKIETALGF